MAHFREVQQFRQPWLWAILLAPMVLAGYGAYQQLALHRPWGNRPVSDTAFAIICASLALMLVWMYSMRLVTEVRDNELVVHFVLLWRRKTIPLTGIRSADALEYSPIFDYGGWGVRRGPGGWAYNVSGNRGVLLKFYYGKDILVGSQRAEELARAIEERRRVSAPSAPPI